MIAPKLRLWIDAVKRMEADPATPVMCPFGDGGTLIVEDIRSEADSETGTRIISCTNCDHSSTSRYRFGPVPVASKEAAE